MALSPEEIERQEFAQVSFGYDADEVRKYLFEVAANLRHARRERNTNSKAPNEHAQGTEATHDVPHDLRTDATRWPARGAAGVGAVDAVSFFIPPAIPAPRPFARERAVAPIPAVDVPDSYDQVGVEVAELLRAAHETVAVILNRSELDALSVREDAEHDAHEIRRSAEADAKWQQDRAKRVLTTVQEQADAILAEAEAQGRSIVAATTEQAELSAKKITERAARHVEDILAAEREALARLHRAQHDVGRAIEAIVRTDNRPIVDGRVAADLRFAVDGPALADLPENRSDPVSPQEWTNMHELARQDPLMLMVRQAVGRAVGAAGSQDETDPAEGETANPCASGRTPHLGPGTAPISANR